MVKFQWSDDCEKNFAELKTRLTTTPVFTLPKGLDGYLIYCDASRVCLCFDAASPFEEERKDLVKDFHRIARLGFHLMSILDNGVTIQNGAEHILVVEVKEKKDIDPILLKLKGVLDNQSVEVISHWGDGVLRYQGRLCVPDMGELRQHILLEVHKSRYSIHLGASKMYLDLWDVYWWNEMKRDIENFVTVKTTNSAEDYAKLYIKEIVRLHGVPLLFILDRGPQFSSHLWKSFQKGVGTQVNLSTTFHPQMDGQMNTRRLPTRRVEKNDVDEEIPPQV
ncbi:hypothetical protein EJD97_017567 [Solanum chilense]|uniref:Integrase zinc-binding domain-containing protein n=1 Tax=Solanum chilense TaxID=4083 RepID=A0A6N2CAA6_SOLCI|nr:hypothetical protein EJD97_017567 [Solanum chilense]